MYVLIGEVTELCIKYLTKLQCIHIKLFLRPKSLKCVNERYCRIQLLLRIQYRKKNWIKITIL